MPNPERFALHKLVVYGERTGAFRVKSTKDLAQAACLLSFPWEHRRENLDESLADMLTRGRGWRARLKQGAMALHKAYPEMSAGEWLLNATL